jgi:hypothetical protein
LQSLALDLTFDYQCRLACGEQRPDETKAARLSHGTDFAAKLIHIPTGVGKTAAVLSAWLRNRVELRRPDWPWRLVYCLPVWRLLEQAEPAPGIAVLPPPDAGEYNAKSSHRCVRKVVHGETS